MNAFVAEYNARLMAHDASQPGAFGEADDFASYPPLGLPFPPAAEGEHQSPAPRKQAAKAKRQRKTAAASRKKNRRRK